MRVVALLKNPEANFRYLPVIGDLKRNYSPGITVLEVGGGDFNLSNFWNIPITVADIGFNPQINPSLITKITVTGPILPLDSDTFDYSVSLDTLEHVPPVNRELFLKEIARVTKKVIYLGFPAGKYAYHQDVLLLQNAPTNKNQFLKEHVENGLPEVLNVVNILRGGGWELKSQDSNVNLLFRNLLMYLWLRSDRCIVWKLLFKTLGLLAPFYKLLSIGKCYRQILVFEKSIN